MPLKRCSRFAGGNKKALDNEGFFVRGRKPLA